MEDYHLTSRYEETPFAQQLLIDAACDSLYQIGFNRNIFTLDRLSDFSYTCDKFLDLIEPISDVKNLDVLRLIFEGFTVKQDFSMFESHIQWLKTTTEGRLFLDNSLRPITEPMKKSDVDLARKLIDYGASCNQTAKDIKKEIEEITLSEEKLQKEIYAIDTELKELLGPLNEFEVLSTQQLRIKAYELYEEDCKLKGINAIPYYRRNGYEAAVAAFGETVKKNHFLDFVNRHSMEIAEHLLKSDSKGEFSGREDLSIMSDDGSG